MPSDVERGHGKVALRLAGQEKREALGENGMRWSWGGGAIDNIGSVCPDELVDVMLTSVTESGSM